MLDKKEEISCDESVVIMSAVRYMLGRRSYGVGCVCDYVKLKKDLLDKSNKEVICRDIKEYFDEHPNAPYKEKWFELVEILSEKK
jgi:hypothetical protein